MSRHPSVSYTVLCEGAGLMHRKLGRYRTEAEARDAASTACRDGWTRNAYVVRNERGTGNDRPNQYIGVYASPYGEDETTRFYRLQAIPFVLPPPSPLDDLGEEE